MKEKNFALRFLLFFILAISSNGQPEPTETYPHKTELDSEGKMKMFWKSDEIFITFEIHGNTSGWIGMGISPTGSMKGADINVGWVKDGIAILTDRYGVGNTYPEKDPEQNLELIEGFESDGWTVIKYQRQLASCDPENDLPITADTLKIIWAFGESDPEGDDLVGSNYHSTNRGSLSLLLLEISSTDENAYPENETHHTFELLNDNFRVPADPTYYNCRLHKIPTFDEKQHLVKIEPVIQPGNELYVHHMLVYQCIGPVNEASIGANAKCYTSNMPSDFSSCRFVIQAWAIGGSTIYYPKHAGFPLGEFDSPKYVTVETHYNNPDKVEGIVDSSGLRFYYTSDLRDYDAGIIETGVTVGGFQHVIPPGSPSFFSYGECSSQCLEEGMKKNDVQELNVFGTLLHSHLMGRGVKSRHIRNGTELPYISNDKSYDFNYQETRLLKDERVILPGDSMQVVCDYNSEDRKNISLGGLDTEKEMCVVYVYYYPKISLTFCETAPEWENFKKYIGIEDFEFVGENQGIYSDLYDTNIIAPTDIAGQSIAHYLNSMDWNEKKIKEFEEDMQHILRIQNCYGYRIIEVDYNIPAVEVDVPYDEKPPQCVIINSSTISPDVTSDFPETTSNYILDTTSYFHPDATSLYQHSTSDSQNSISESNSIPTVTEADGNALETTTGGVDRVYLSIPVYVMSLLVIYILA